jgi:hypothetical protein
VGLGLGPTGALVRPDTGAGLSSFALFGVITGEWAPLAAETNAALVRGLALRADFGGTLYGPGAVTLDVGGRWAIPIFPKLRIFVGPEVALGGFFVTTGDKESRFLLRTDAFAAIGFGEHVQLELAFDIQSALGGSGAIVTAGPMLRGLVRF